MRKANFKGYHIRKWFTQIEDTLANESGQAADGAPLRKIVIAAAIHNPYAGKFSRTLDRIVKPSPLLGTAFGERIRELAGAGGIQSYGKACLVGTAGEYEHGNAFLTSVFADPVRDAIGGGMSWVPSSGKRGGPGTAIDIPLAHKDALYVRSHYDTVTATFSDAPAPDEVVVIFAFATRGRLHARLGGLKAGEVKGKDGLR
ncbi:MAG: amino acid synthesis family protein [Betaproteobacteria bacterium]|nr:amino acid synthesis family protein [Betaproteobacteria bacterium]